MAVKLGGAGDMFGDYLRVDWVNLLLKVDAMDLQTQNSPDLFRKCQSLMAADKSIDGGGHSSSDSKIGPKWKPLFVPGKHNSNLVGKKGETAGSEMRTAKGWGESRVARSPW